MSIARQAARGAAWTILFGFGARAIGLTGTLVMTHLVAPEVIGEVAAATIVVMVFSWVSSWGFGVYAVIKGRGEVADEVTWHCTVAHVVLGGSAMIAVALLGGVIMPWFEVPDAAAYVPLTALAFGFRRLFAMAETTLTRQMRFRAIGVSLAAGETAYAIVSLVLAWRGHGGMSVVYGNVAQSLAIGAVLVAAAGLSWARPMRLRAARFRDMARFGLPLCVEGVAHNAARYGDKLMLASSFGPGPMAHYNMGYNLADIPAVYVGEQIGTVLLPSLAALPPERRPAALERSTALLALIIFPMAVGLAAVSESLVGALLSAEWQGVAPLLTILSLLAVFRPIGWTLATYLEVREQTGQFMFLEIGKLAILLLGIALLQRWGIEAAACAVGLAYGANAAAAIWLVTRGPEPKPSWRRLVSGFVRPLIACAAMAAAVLAARHGLRHLGVDSPRILLPIEIAIGAAVYVMAALAVARPTARDFLDQLRHLRRRGAVASGDAE